MGASVSAARGDRGLHAPALSRQNVSVNSKCHGTVVVYDRGVPKLWNETIDAHRAAVREAILETTAALAHEHGLTSVTMSQIATEAGIGRATLYKYFPDVESILLAWHEQKINTHLRQLTEVRDHTEDPDRQLEAVLQTYAENAFGRHDADLGAL